MSNTKREPGYYKVKYKGVKLIAFLEDSEYDLWLLYGSRLVVSSHYFDEIGEKIEL